MRIGNLIERKIERFIPRDITLYLMGLQLIGYVASYRYPWLSQAMSLQGDAVLSGQWWRLLTFLFVPFPGAPIWVVLEWYLAYIFGSALELVWGAYRYAVYLCVASVFTVVAAFIFPYSWFSNGYIYGSVFLAFAYLNPDFTLLLFFIIPVKVKWLAILAWLTFGWTFLTGGMAARVQTVLSVGTFFVFFGTEIIYHIKDRMRQGAQLSSRITKKDQPMMRCATCRATEQDGKIFYYCSECVPGLYYCEDHIHTHKHLSN